MLLARGSAGNPIASPAIDPEGLERSLEMLRIEWKLAVLETYYAQAKFYVPAQWPGRLQDEYRRLAAEAGNASDVRLKGIDEWLAASREEAENEVLEMYKLVEERIGQLAGFLKSDAEGKQLEQEWQTYRATSKKNALEVARFMEGITGRIRLANKGPESDPDLAKFSKRWEDNARKIYRGSIADTDALIKSIAEHEHNRKKIETRLAYLKGVEEALEWSSTVQGIIEDPSGKAIEKLEEYAQQKALAWMKSRYNDIDDAAFKKTWGEAKGILTEVATLHETVSGLDEDKVLLQNPTALAMAKKCAIASAVYKQTLGQLKKLPGSEIAGPLFDLLDFYGDMLGAVPAIARKMQGFVDKSGQGFKIGALDAFAIVKEAELLWEDQRLRDLGLQIAVDTKTDDTAPQARYYMLVPKEVSPRGYATLDRAQYLRLCESIAYERFINAPKEAWRGPYDWATDFVFGGRNAEALSANVSPAYLNDLTAKARKHPFSPADLIALAQGQSVKLSEKEQTHATLAQAADDLLDSRAQEMMLRKSTGTADSRAAWRAYEELLRKHQVALSPKQIQNLFSHYQGGEAGAAQVAKYLTALSQERTSRAQGVPAVGVPVILLPQPRQKVEPGMTTNLSADVFVSRLQKGRTVEGTAKWELPKWAAPVPDQPVKVGNGVTQITCPISVPKGVDLKPFEVKVTVSVPADPGENAVARAAAAVAAAAGKIAAGVEQTALPPKLAPGGNDFGMDVPEPGAPVIALRRGGDSTLIEVKSDALSALTAGSNNSVLLTLYFADSESGPMRKARDQGEYVSRQSETIEKSSNRTGWIDKDTFVMVHSAIIPAEEPGSCGPFFYQVTQQRAGEFGDPIGKETRSKVVGSNGKATVRMFDEIKDGVLQANRQGEWWAASVALAVEDQGVDIQGAHVTVTCGKWTGHFFTSRQEGRFSYGSGGQPNVTGSRTHIRFPASGGSSVTVNITGNGFSANASYKLPPIDEEIARGKKAADEIRERTARYVKSTDEALKNAQAQLKFHQDKAKDRQPGKTFLEAHDRGNLGMATLHANVRRYSEYSGQHAKTAGAIDAAMAEGNWPAALAACGEFVGLVKIDVEIRREEAQAELAARRAVMAVPGESGALRKSYEDECKRLEEKIKDLPRQEAALLSGVYDQQARLAMLAGDAGTYQQARANQLLALEAGGFRADAQASTLFAAADETAMLSGSQSEAGALWNAAWEKNIAATPAEYRAERQAYFSGITSFPAYLPSRSSNK